MIKLTAYRKKWVKAESIMETNGLMIHINNLDEEVFEIGTKGYLVVINKSNHTGLQRHNVPLIAAPVHFTNFKKFHFRKWCVKRSESSCSSYHIVEESDSRNGSTTEYMNYVLSFIKSSVHNIVIYLRKTISKIKTFYKRTSHKS